MPSTTIEICIDAVDSALAAQHGGAQRVELCSNLLEGGTTPSAGLIKTVRDKTSLGLQVMVRPRGGDFCYNDDEFEVMCHDVTAAKSLGADGIVIGLLNTDGSIDIPRTSQLVELAKPLPVTFHRAFDVATNLPGALQELIKIGIARVLTSGGEPSATLGIPALTELVQASAGRITILAGGGINSTNVADIVEKTGVKEVHAGLRTVISGRMQQSDKKISPGVGGMDESQRFVVLEENVARMSQAIAGIKHSS